MSSGLHNGVSGLSLGTGLYRNVSGLWGGASGLVNGFGFSPTILFAAGEAGGWYDPSDVSTLFQDDAGTVPVTAPGQTVGCILDKSGQGNHLTQATLSKRPVYGTEPLNGRRNLLTYTEQFNNAVWVKSTLGTALAPVDTPNTAVAPDGTSTADTVVFDANGTTSSDRSRLSQSISTAALTQYVLTMWVRSAVPVTLVLATNFGSTGTGAVSGASTINVTTSWTRFSATGTSGSTGGSATFELRSNGNLQPSAVSVEVWGADVEVGSVATAYQRVTSRWDVTEAGVPSVSYLQFDALDDWFVSPTITPGVDEAQVFAGVYKASDAATGNVMETSTSVNVNNGAIRMTSPISTFPNFGMQSRGTVSTAATAPNSYPAPLKAVLAAVGDISGDSAVLRVNGAQVAASTADQGTGNYLAYPMYVGSRAGTSNFLNGRIYSLIVRFGANLDAAAIAATEAWVNSQTGAY